MRLISAAILVASVAAAADDFVIFRERGSADPYARGSRERKKQVREKILRLLGGLPEYRNPLHVKQMGTVIVGIIASKIVYNSLPGFHVTADVYVPTHGTQPFPAILMPVRPRRVGAHVVLTARLADARSQSGAGQGGAQAFRRESRTRDRRGA